MKKRIPLVRPAAMVPGDVFVETKVDGFGALLFVVEREFPDPPVYTPGQRGTATVDTPDAIEHGRKGTFVQWGDEGIRFVLDNPVYGEVNLIDPSAVSNFVEGGTPVTQEALTDALIYTESEREDSLEWSTDAKILLDHIRDNN